MHHIKKSVIKWVLVCIACLAFGFTLGKFKFDVAQDLITDLRSEVVRLTDNNDKLENKKGLLEIDQIAKIAEIKGLRKNNFELQESVTKLSTKIYFYERVISPERSKSGVQVSLFEIAYNSKTKQWDYELVLMQSEKGRRLLKGKYEFNLTYFKGKDKKLYSANIKEFDEKVNLNFKFKYFQTIKSSLVLPEGVTVDEIIITLKVRGSRWYKAQSVRSVFEWRTLVDENPEALEEFDKKKTDNEHK